MELLHRVSAVDRLLWQERYIEAAAQAICHRHRHAAKLARTAPEELSDGQLVDTVMRLEAWLMEQLALPVDPDSWIARKDV